MNILWLSHFLPYPPKGGLRQRSYHLLRAAAERHRVCLVALNQKALLPERGALEEATAALEHAVERFAWFEIPADRTRLYWTVTAGVSYFLRSPFDVNWLRSPRMRRHLRSGLGSERFDVVHLDTLGLWPYARELGDTPIVLNHHNIESEMMARRSEKEPSPLKRHYFRREAIKLARLEQEACPAAQNLVVSALDAERLHRVSGASRITVIPNGVDTDYFSPRGNVKPRPSSMVFAGGLNWYPNRDAVLYFLREVWPLLQADRAERSLTVVGKHPPAELLEATRDPRIRAPGFVDDVRPFLDEAEVYVCPIRDGGGTRLKILDALAMAKPLVATALAVEGLGLREELHYLRAEAPRDYLRQIQRLDADPNLRRRLGMAGRALVEQKYRWASIGQELAAAYEEAQGRGAASTPHM